MSAEADALWVSQQEEGRVQWNVGMLTLAGYRVLESDPEIRTSERVMVPVGYESREEWGVIDQYDRPDWNDAATIGCLLAQARAVNEDPGLHTEPHPARVGPTWPTLWLVYCGSGGTVSAGDTEAEALLIAIKVGHNDRTRAGLPSTEAT